MHSTGNASIDPKPPSSTCSVWHLAEMLGCPLTIWGSNNAHQKGLLRCPAHMLSPAGQHACQSRGACSEQITFDCWAKVVSPVPEWPLRLEARPIGQGHNIFLI